MHTRRPLGGGGCATLYHMITNQLTDYLRNQLKAGVPVEKLREGLIAAGWRKVDVDAGLAELIPAGAPVPTPVSAEATPMPLPDGSVQIVEDKSHFGYGLAITLTVMIVPLLILGAVAYYLGWLDEIIPVFRAQLHL